MKAKTCQANNGGKSMITVVNPIYDCVFKYLMEDERIDFAHSLTEERGGERGNATP